MNTSVNSSNRVAVLTGICPRQQRKYPWRQRSIETVVSLPSVTLTTASHRLLVQLLPLVTLLFLVNVTGVDAQSEAVYVRVDHNASLVCPRVPEGTPSQQPLLWWKDDVLLQPPGGSGGRGSSPQRIWMRNSQLYIARVVADDSGEYACGHSTLRKASGTVKLFVQDVPDPPGTPLVGFFSSRTVDLSWTTSRHAHHSPILHYIIEIRVGEHGEWDSRNRVMTKDNVTRHQLIGLQPFTVYSFRVLAVNAIGASKPSKESYYMITLREVPEGKPHIVYAQNTSSTSIRIQWTPPPKNTIHGEFEGYRITYKQRDRPDDEAREVVIRNSQTTHYTIRNLEVWTQYLVSLQVFNPAGRGPSVVVPVMTDEGIPSAPMNLTADKVTQASVLLHWAEPAQPNGVIRGYLIHFSHASSRNETQVKKVIGSRPFNEYILSDLKPFSLYHIWVKAYTQRHTGDNSNAVEVKTDVAGPSAPPIFNLTCHNSDSLYIAWGRPSRYYSHVDMYYVHYRSEYAWSFEEIAMDASLDPSQEHHMLIPNLTANTLYEVKVQGATRSVLYHSKLYKGEFSESRRVILSGTGGKCQSWLGGQYPYSGGVGAALIAGVVCLTFALLLALVSFFLWKKYFQAAYYYLDDPLPGERASSTLVLLSDTFEDGDCKPIDVCQWPKHVADLHSDGDIGFSREYDSLQASFEAELSSDFSQLDENKPKNRYVNIVAYDHTRVTLKPLSEKQSKRCPDYINANYIDGYQKPRAYIGTQGPMPSTFDDYWRMVWEQRVHVIVMITNLVERSRRKCDQYWPSEGSCSYGQLQVKFISEDVMSTYTVRTFQVRHLKQKKAGERTVVQYHYTNWPDHGVPDHPLPVLSFVVRSAAANPPTAGPMIVHCSAGVGRTGTYIVIDAMLRMMRHKHCINVYGFLKHIRRQRNYLVQTEEQYVFIHDALLEAIESGAPTEVPAGQLPRFVQTLAQPSASGGPSLLERQFKLVTVFKAKDFNVVSALKPCNKSKNRSLNLLPIEHYRVHITAKPGQEGSDYINATFVQGFRRLREYVLTQHPMQETVTDFWQMVWDHHMKVLVLLCCDQDGKEYPGFFPSQVGASETHDQFVVKRDTNGKLILKHGQDADSLEITLLHAPTWLSGCKALFELFSLIKQALTAQGSGETPVLVVDRIGGTEGATFCVLSSLYQQINSPLERAADVYLYAKLLHLRRPGVWRSIQDLHSLYQALSSLEATLIPDTPLPPYNGQATQAFRPSQQLAASPPSTLILSCAKEGHSHHNNPNENGGTNTNSTTTAASTPTATTPTLSVAVLINAVNGGQAASPLLSPSDTVSVVDSNSSQNQNQSVLTTKTPTQQSSTAIVTATISSDDDTPTTMSNGYQQQQQQQPQHPIS